MDAEKRWAVAWAERARLLHIARLRVPTKEDAEDVVAEAIARVGTQQNLPLSAVPAWLTRVVVNLCVDRQRRLKTQRAALERAELRPEPVPSHEDDVVARAEALWVAAAVQDLPERQATTLRLRADGLDNGAIARRLDLSVASIEGLVKRSRSVLREALRAAGAVAVALWAMARASRRPATIVAAASVALLLAIVPWTGPPGDLETPPPRALPALPAQAAPRASSSPTTKGATGLPQSTAERPKAVRVAAPTSARSRIGQPLPYAGPRCLAPYCLPIVDDTADASLGSTAPKGWSPADLHDYLDEPAYSSSASGRRPLVAVVSWFGFPFTADDLAVYRRTFQLPACTMTDGCLQLHTASAPEAADETASSLAFGSVYAATPRTVGRSYGMNPGAEQAQMLQGVSATCPECRLALVVAETDSINDLSAAFKRAQALRPAAIITNLSLPHDPARDQAPLLDPALYDGSLVLVAGGRGGFDPTVGTVPGRLPNVVMVGGTEVDDGLVVSNGDNATFCNTDVSRPSWQTRLGTGCSGRAGMDLVLPGGKYSGLAVYVSGGVKDGRGWYHPGHTTQAVAVFGGLLARHGLNDVVHAPADLYAHPEWFADITRGTSGCYASGCTNDQTQDDSSCRKTVLCTSRPGWDGPSGLGEPRHLPWR